MIDFFAKSPFTEDVYVKALEVRPGLRASCITRACMSSSGCPTARSCVNGRIVDADGKPMARNQVGARQRRH